MRAYKVHPKERISHRIMLKRKEGEHTITFM